MAKGRYKLSPHSNTGTFFTPFPLPALLFCKKCLLCIMQHKRAKSISKTLIQDVSHVHVALSLAIQLRKYNHFLKQSITVKVLSRNSAQTTRHQQVGICCATCHVKLMAFINIQPTQCKPQVVGAPKQLLWFAYQMIQACTYLFYIHLLYSIYFRFCFTAASFRRRYQTCPLNRQAAFWVNSY